MEISWNEAKAAFRHALADEMGFGACELAAKWEDGTLVLKPGDSALQSKEVPIETFFKKITAVRERLRVLEQKINNSKALSATERAEFQQLLSRASGSLTTFNVLFRHEEDKFEGMSG